MESDHREYFFGGILELLESEFYVIFSQSRAVWSIQPVEAGIMPTEA
jgi:hypothetical protein